MLSNTEVLTNNVGEPNMTTVNTTSSTTGMEDNSK
jgi:hypothetical protein